MKSSDGMASAKEKILRSCRTIVALGVALVSYASESNAFNYIFLNGVGGEMMCSDWQRAINPGEKAVIAQWVFGFITGYDAAIRPKLSEGSLNGEQIAYLIVDFCKREPGSDLPSAAKYIAAQIQKEINGEINPPIILNRRSTEDTCANCHFKSPKN
jgi:hypothetical protein